MIQVETDTVRNVLRITFSQYVGKRQAGQYLAEIEAALAKLSPGFRVLTDLSGLERMEYSCGPEIQAVMDLCREKGVGKIVRVIPDPQKDIGFKLLSFFHYGRDVPIVTCTTLAEATESLSS